MRRIAVILMLVSGLVAVISGIVEAIPRHSDRPLFHIFVSAIFVILCIIHIFLNRRAISKYFKGSKQRA